MPLSLVGSRASAFHDDRTGMNSEGQGCHLFCCLQHLLGAPFRAVWTDSGYRDGHKAEKPMVCGCH